VIAALFVVLAAASPGDDVVRRAMADEMARAMKDLHIPNEPRPHRIVYVITDADEVNASATFGASIGTNARHWRNLRVEVRVGDRTFDSGNFADGGFFLDFPLPVALDDDYLALRRELWLRTDDAFKHAVDAIAKKHAAEKAQAKSDDDAAFDFAEAKPAQLTTATDASQEKPDAAALDKIVTALSGVLREFPAIQSSRAGGGQVVFRQRLLTSDGSWKDDRRSLVELDVSVETQAEDGMRLHSWSNFQAANLHGLPPLAEMVKSVKAMASDVSASRKAPIGDNGNAVVLFEGRAAGQLLRRLLGDQLGGTPAAHTATGARSTSDLAGKLGQRIAPTFLDVYDDPRSDIGPGKIPLFGAYQIDDEGVVAERVSLVEKGVLKSLLMSRTPRKEIATSNGHGRGRPSAGAVRGRVGVLFVSGGKTGLDGPALRARAIKEAKAAGDNVPVYVVRHIDTIAPVTDRVRPLQVFRLRDGKEEPVRGITFVNLLPRSLKDIAAVGKEPVVYNALGGADGPPTIGGVSSTVITPSVLFKDVEVKKDTDKHPRPPLYPHPSFAEK
jgi:predicted Zn-dependent protease